MTDIVIAGGGPTALMLACELRLAGAEPVVLEELPEISQVPKGNGLVGQIVPMLDYRGQLERFSAGSTFSGPVPRYSFGPLRLDFSKLGDSPLHILAIPQRRLEERLGEWLAELGGTVRRGHKLTALSCGDDGVTLDVTGPDGDYQLQARYLVGCDGAHSLVRKQAGIAFPGVTSSEISRIGRVLLPTAKAARGGKVKVPGIGRLKLMTQVRTPGGVYSIGPLAALDKSAPAGAYIVFTKEDDPSVDPGTPMTLDELSASVRRVLGDELPMADPLLLTRLVGNSRLADRYRAGRILLAGDAAHISGAGGSLNTGMLDAVNLGWKLAAVAQGRAPDGLLDSYHAERHLAGQHVITQTRAQSALTAGPAGASKEGAEALREIFGDAVESEQVRELLKQPGQLRRIGEMIEGSDVRYPMPASPHPLLGKLSPDLRLETRDGRTRVAELMRAARTVLLDLTAGTGLAAAPTVAATVADAAAGWEHQAAAAGWEHQAAAAGWEHQVKVVAARCLTRPVPAAALLIRPDGYVAWAADAGTPDPAAGLNDALRAWTGRP